MDTILLPPKFSRALTEVTNEPRPDVALEIVIKEYIKFRLDASIKKIEDYEKKWKMSFEEFKNRCKSNTLPDDKDPYSWEVENDYREWESAVTLRDHYNEIIERWLV